MINLWYSHELLSACYETRIMVKSLGVHRVWKCHELESQGHHRFHGLWKSYDSLCTLWKFSDHCFIGNEIPMILPVSHEIPMNSLSTCSTTRQNSHEIYMIDLWYSHELLSACYETRVMVKSLGVHRVWKCHELESQGHHRFHGLWKSYDSVCTLWKFSDHCFIGYEIPMILPVSHEIWFHWPWNTYEFSQHMQEGRWVESYYTWVIECRDKQRSGAEGREGGKGKGKVGEGVGHSLRVS